MCARLEMLALNNFEKEILQNNQLTKVIYDLVFISSKLK